MSTIFLEGHSGRWCWCPSNGDLLQAAASSLSEGFLPAPPQRAGEFNAWETGLSQWGWELVDNYSSFSPLSCVQHSPLEIPCGIVPWLCIVNLSLMNINWASFLSLSQFFTLSRYFLQTQIYFICIPILVSCLLLGESKFSHKHDSSPDLYKSSLWFRRSNKKTSPLISKKYKLLLW